MLHPSAPSRQRSSLQRGFTALVSSRGHLVLGLALVVLICSAPTSVHAAWFSIDVNDLVHDVLVKILSLEADAITFLTGAINTVIGWQSVKQAGIIGTTWAVARNLANMTFIVGLVVIAFATIFRPFGGFFRGYYYRTALPKFLLAAILVNLSLGICLMVLGISNGVTTTMTNILGKEALVSLPRELGTVRSVALAPANAEYNLNQSTLQALREIGVEYTQGAASNQEVQDQAFNEYDQALEKCQTEQRPLMSFGPLVGYKIKKSASYCRDELLAQEEAALRLTWAYQRHIDSTEQWLGAEGFSIEEIDRKALIAAQTNVRQGTTTADGRVVDKSSLVWSALMSVINHSVVIIAILAAIIFFIFRVVALTFLTAFSALAFAALWIPDNNWFSGWWKQFIGWNVFGPLYLLVLVFGMSFLRQRAALAGTGLGDLSDIFGLIFTLIIFLGGLALTYQSSFAASVRSTQIIGGAAQRFGAFGAVNASAWLGKRAGGAAWRRTGGAAVDSASANFQATRERIAQAYGRVRPEMLRPKDRDEKLATAQRKMGVYGGAQAEQQQTAKRVGSRQTDIENSLKMMTRGENEEKDAFKARQRNELERLSSSGDNAQRLAARQVMMDKGWLGSEGIAETKKMYGTPLAQAEFEKDIDKTASKNPMQVYEYRKNELGDDADDKKLADLRQKYFGNVVKNPEAFSKLPSEYFKDEEALGYLEEAVNRTWDPSTERGRKGRSKMYERLMSQEGMGTQQMEAVEKMFANQQEE